MTRELLNRLPQVIVNKVEQYRARYTKFDSTVLREMHMKDETRSRMAAYVEGLRDAGVITERERQCLFVYMTV